MRQRNILAVSFIVLLGCLLYLAANLPVFFLSRQLSFKPPISITSPTSFTADNTWVTVKVARVIDGDTIEIDGGQKVRYIGIDTPETVDPRKAIQCFGKEASNKNKQLVEGKFVRLEKDISETDKYGRLLGYVWLDNTLINEYLVKVGFAHVSTFPPDVKYEKQFLQAQQYAQKNSLGLWQSCPKTGP